MLPQEVTGLIGQSSPARIFEVEKGAIRKFADAVDDRNPLYWDDEHARKSKYGGIIAPPGFFGWPVTWKRGATIIYEAPIATYQIMVNAGFSSSFDGGIEYEFFKPIRAGDILSVVDRIKDIVVREGKTGMLAFVTTEMVYTNKNGEIVANARRTAIFRREQSAGGSNG